MSKKNDVSRAIELAIKEGGEDLDLSNCSLKAIPSAVLKCKSIKNLYLHGNQLTSVPSEISKLTKLETLTLYSNKIKNIPESIGKLKRLKSLSLQHNKLDFLPDSIGSLTALEDLSLSDNLLTNLPDSFGNLSQLRELFLLGNRLRNLPDSFDELSSLKALSIQSNPLPPDLLAAFERCIDAVFDWLAARKSGALESFFAGKLVIIGEGGAGKTTLLRALCDEPTESITEEDSTVALDTRVFSLPHPTNHGQTIRFNAWDFGGQLQYRAGQELFYSGNAIYLVVWDPRANYSLDHIRQWMAQVGAKAGGHVRFIIVATNRGNPNLDIRIEDFPTWKDEFGSRLIGEESMWVESIKSSREGVDELKKLLAAEAVRDGYFERGVFRNRVPFYEWTRSEDAPGLCLRSFIRETLPIIYKGAKQEINEPELEESLEDLYTMGEILIRKEEIELQALIILRPETLGKAIARITTSEAARKGNGFIDHQEMSVALSKNDKVFGAPIAEEYHERLWYFMRHCRACFRVPRGDAEPFSSGRSLFSEQVSRIAPKGFQECWPKKCPKKTF